MPPPEIPIFPLPNVVLFPNVFLPLHIFEPRYREMVRDALNGDRLIGMVLLRNGLEQHSAENPPVYPIGCSGLITHVEHLPTGSYNIVLRGFEKFRVLDEDHRRMYRLARVDSIAEPLNADQRSRLQAERTRLEDVLDRRLVTAGSESRVPREMPADDLVNALAQYLEFEPIEKQALLQREGVLDRCLALIDLLEMKLMLADGSFPAGRVQ